MALNVFADCFRCRESVDFRRTTHETIVDCWEVEDEYMIHNGAMLLEKQISCGHGKLSNSNPLMIFSIKEIKRATDYFDIQLMFHQKATTKYRGKLENSHVVVIESPWSQNYFNPLVPEFFLNEVAVNQILNHRNVVKLHGCCLETKLPILVHEFLSDANLYDHVHGRRDTRFNNTSIPPFNIPWSKLVKIAADISHALSYMHLALSKPIVHLDVRPDNIWLDESFNAKLGNFGTSVTITPGEDFINKYQWGRPEYMDPEYGVTWRVTEKCDVYSFGVVLVELLTGKDPGEVWGQQHCTLGEYFSRCLKGDNWVVEILHPRVLREAAAEEIQAFAGLAVKCVAGKGEDRPTMREVAIELRRMHLAAKQSKVESESSSH